METGFKVLEVGRWSCWMKHVKNGFPLRYSKGKWTKPKKGNGPIGLFASRERAEEWAHSRRFSATLKVHECKYKPSKATSLWRFVKGKKRAAKKIPSGTIFAASVKCTE